MDPEIRSIACAEITGRRYTASGTLGVVTATARSVMVYPITRLVKMNGWKMKPSPIDYELACRQPDFRIPRLFVSIHDPKSGIQVNP